MWSGPMASPQSSGGGSHRTNPFPLQKRHSHRDRITVGTHYRIRDVIPGRSLPIIRELHQPAVNSLEYYTETDVKTGNLIRD